MNRPPLGPLQSEVHKLKLMVLVVIRSEVKLIVSKSRSGRTILILHVVIQVMQYTLLQIISLLVQYLSCIIELPVFIHAKFCILMLKKELFVTRLDRVFISSNSGSS